MGIAKIMRLLGYDTQDIPELFGYARQSFYSPNCFKNKGTIENMRKKMKDIAMEKHLERVAEVVEETNNVISEIDKYWDGRLDELDRPGA